jgi:hypothetical protein
MTSGETRGNQYLMQPTPKVVELDKTPKINVYLV